MSRASGKEHLEEGGKINVRENVMSIIDEGGGMRFTMFAIIIGRVTFRKVRGATRSTISHSQIDGTEDFDNDQAGSKSGKGAALDAAFRLKEHVAVEVFTATPESGGVSTTEIIEREEVVKIRVGGHDVAAGLAGDLVETAS